MKSSIWIKYRLRSGWLYLLGHHGRLDSIGHCIHTGSHSQVVQPLILLANGVLSIDPCSLFVSLFKSLHNACVSREVGECKEAKWHQDRIMLEEMLISSLPLVQDARDSLPLTFFTLPF